MLHITTLAVGELEANCHIVTDDEQNAVLIDPGAEAPYILRELNRLDAKPLAILLTHAHFDHFGAAGEIMRQTGIPLYVHPLDEPMLRSAAASMAAGLGMAESYHSPEPEGIRHMEEGDELKFSDELTFTVLHTPGHSPGGCCLKHGDILFTGDTLFRDSVGRIDFAGGNIKDMRASLARLGKLDGDCTCYCGHFMNTTLSHERQFNHYVNPSLKTW